MKVRKVIAIIIIVFDYICSCCFACVLSKPNIQRRKKKENRENIRGEKRDIKGERKIIRKERGKYSNDKKFD